MTMTLEQAQSDMAALQAKAGEFQQIMLNLANDWVSYRKAAECANQKVQQVESNIEAFNMDLRNNILRQGQVAEHINSLKTADTTPTED